MAITVNRRTVQRNGRTTIVLLECNFATTETTGTVTVGEITMLENFSFGLIGAAALAAAEVLSLSETTHLQGGIITISGQSLAVARVGASVTSGLHFMLRLEGY